MPPRNLNLGVVFVGQVHPSVRQAITQVTQAINQATAGTRNMTVSFQQQNTVLATATQRMRAYTDEVRFFLSRQAAWYGAKAILFAAVDIPKQIAKMGYDFAVQLDSARAKLDRYDSMLGQTNEHTKAAVASLVEMMRVLNLKYPGTPFEDIVKSADRLRAAGAEMKDIRGSLESFVQFQTAWPDVEMDKFTKAVVGFVNTYRGTPAFAIMANDAERYKAVLDKLSVAAGIGVIEPKDMNIVIQHLGQMAQVAGLTVDQMLALAVEMTNLGNKAGPAARALRGMLQTLQRSDALDLFEQLNIKIDKTIPLGGQLVSIFTQLKELTGKGEQGMSVQAMSVLNKIFSTERVSSAIALIREMEQFESLLKTIETSEMAVAKASQDMNNQLKNKWELLKKVAAEIGTLVIQSDLLSAALWVVRGALWAVGSVLNGVNFTLREIILSVITFITAIRALRAYTDGDSNALTAWWDATGQIWKESLDNFERSQQSIDRIMRSSPNIVEEALTAKMKKLPFHQQNVKKVGEGEYEFAGSIFKTEQEAKQWQARLSYHQFNRGKPEVKSDNYPNPNVPGKSRYQGGYMMSEMKADLAIQRAYDAAQMAYVRFQHAMGIMGEEEFFNKKEELREKDFNSEMKIIEDTRDEVEEALKHKKVTEAQKNAEIARLDKEEAELKSKNYREMLVNLEEYERARIQIIRNNEEYLYNWEKTNIDWLTENRAKALENESRNNESLYSRGRITFGNYTADLKKMEDDRYKNSREMLDREFVNRMQKYRSEMNREGTNEIERRKIYQERLVYVKEYNDKVELLQQDHVNNLIDINRKWAEEMELGFGSGLDKLKKDYYNVGKMFEDITIQFANRMTQAFTDGFVNFFLGKTEDIKEAFKSLLEDIIRMMTELTMKLAMNTILTSYTGGGANFGNMWGGILHSGGTVGAGSLATRMISGGFARVAHGGLNNEEYLAILKKGETVYPPGKVPSGGAYVDVSVNVENKTGFPVNAKESGMKFDGKRYVKGIILELANTDPQVRNYLGRA